jgi:site-specific recombinase XerD
MINIAKVTHRDTTQILIKTHFDQAIISAIKTIPGSKYTATYKGWLIPYDKHSWSYFTELGIPYTIVHLDEVSKDSRSPQQYDGSPSNVKPQKQNALPLQSRCTKTEVIQASTLINSIQNQPGTALALSDSDIAGIADHILSAPSVHPSQSASKGTDIHQTSKGGRSIEYSGGKFFIKINYCDEEIRFLKSLKGFWQSKIKKWIIKATCENLENIQAKYNFWDQNSYDKLKNIILYVEYPYLVTLYRTPELQDKVVVLVSGYKSNIDIIKNVTDRYYQKEDKKWIIPADSIIVQQLKDDYIRDGATIVDRLPQGDVDYNIKRESYGQFKLRYLAKTEVELKPIVERYIDTMIALKRSQRTMTTYLGPFILFVKCVGLTNIETLNSRDIDKYMATIGSEKVSDGYLHNAFNAIMFYYRDVMRVNENIINQARRPKKDHTLPKVLSVSEVDRIMRAISNLKHNTILYTFYSSGIRLNEILSLRVEDMWWDRNQIFINKGKGNKDRVVPFSGVLKQLLRQYFDEYKPIYWLFEGQDKKHPYSSRSVQLVVTTAAKRAAINKKVTPHTLRHCYATHLMDGGTDVRYIQELLGHSDIKTTLIYTHVTNHQTSKIESPLDKLMRERDKD